MNKTIDLSSIESATLLSCEEARKYEEMIPPVEEAWWLRSPGISDRYAACVYSGSLSHNPVRYQLGVRPALRISNPESLNPSEKFKFGEQTFTYLGEGLALCDDIVGNCAFREDWEASDTNDYEASDVKAYVENWFEKTKQAERDLGEPLKFDVNISVDPVAALTSPDVSNLVLNTLLYTDYYAENISDMLADMPEVQEAFDNLDAVDKFSPDVLVINRDDISFEGFEGSSVINYVVPCEFNVDKFKEMFMEKEEPDLEEPDR